MLWIGNGKYPQIATIWQIEDKGKYAEVRMSTSSKNQDGTYSSSNWSFVRFVGKAHNDELLAMLPRKDNPIRLEIKGGLTQESYVDKDGNKKYPKNPSFIVWEWTLSEYNGGGNTSHKTGMDSPPIVEESDGDEGKLPWEIAGGEDIE